jgi:hypothetical protein
MANTQLESKKITISMLKKDQDLYLKVLNLIKTEYLETFMRIPEFLEKYKLGGSAFQYILKKENLKKDKKKFSIYREPGRKEILDAKVKSTKLERYGDENFNNWELNQKRRLEKYNGKYFSEEAIEKLKNISEDEKERRKEKQKATMLERYGVDNIFKNGDYMRKCYQEKLGVDNPSQLQEVKDKKAQTCLKHFGVDCSWKNPETIKKAQKTCLERYGCKNANQSELIQEKSRQTRFKNGNQRFDKTEVKRFLDQWDKKRKPTAEDFRQYVNISNVSNAHKFIAGSGLKDNFNIGTSYLEAFVEDFLKKNNLTYEKHNRDLIKPKELDFYLPDYKLALEVNDIWSHNSSVGHYGHSPRPITYHFEKTMLCRDKGIRLIHLYEPHLYDEHKWEVLQDIILHACGKSKKIYARNLDLEIKPAIELKDFFDQNNINGYRNAKTAFVLVNKETREPIMAYSVGHAFFGKGKYDAEITRGACKLGYSVVGGASKLWKVIMDFYKDKNLDNQPGSINSIVYYVDLNYYNGKSINFLPNTEMVKEQYGFWNYLVSEKRLVNRDPMHHQEMKDLEKQGKLLVIGNSGTQVNVWKR